MNPPTFGTLPPDALRADRLLVHHAAWLVGSTAWSLLSPQDDDSQTNLGVEADGARLASRPLDDRGLRLELLLAELRLAWTRGDHDERVLDLTGHTMQQAWDWLNATRPAGTEPVAPRPYPDFPAHPLGEGAPFAAGDAAARAELGRVFAAADAALRTVLDGDSDASEPRVWPHHFDLGALMALDAARSVGLGLSPGDEHIDQPYFYVTAWPQPSPDALPAWSGPGRWHTEDFLALVLEAEEWFAAGDEQAALAEGFLSRATAVCRALLEDQRAD